MPYLKKAGQIVFSDSKKGFREPAGSEDRFERRLGLRCSSDDAVLRWLERAGGHRPRRFQNSVGEIEIEGSASWTHAAVDNVSELWIRKVIGSGTAPPSITQYP